MFSGERIADGIWYQYTTPVAVQSGDKTFCSYLTTDGEVMVASYDHQANTCERTLIDSGFGASDHSAPALLVRNPDQRIIVFYTKHNDKTLHWRISWNTQDISSFGPVHSFITSADKSLTYPQPVQLSNENNRIYVFFRATNDSLLNREWRHITSDDYGTTFGGETTLRENFSTFSAGTVNPYTIPVSDGGNRIHFVSFDYEQIAKGGRPRNVYHWYYEGGHFYKSDGTHIKSSDHPLVEAWEPTRLHEVAHVNIWDIALDANGNPVIAYVLFEDYQADHRYVSARWDGKQWLLSKISEGGAPLAEATGREWYSGGCALNHSDPSIAYTSCESSDGVFDVLKHERDSNEEWAVKERYRGCERSKNFRPASVRNADHSAIEVVWCAGRYVDLNDWGPVQILASAIHTD